MSRGHNGLFVRDLTLRFGQATVLRGLNLALPSSGCTMIMGANGAGKSKLLQLMHGLIAPSTGTVCWGDTPAVQATRRQAMVFQKPVLLRRSVAANIEFVLNARGQPRHLCQHWLDHVGLAHKARQPARLLSGGEAQRLALARALATQPDVLFLDEPTASLDPASVLAIEDIVRQAKDAGTRIIFISHDIGQARRMADEVVFLAGGEAVEHTPAQQFFNHPRSTAARNYLDGKIVV